MNAFDRAMAALVGDRNIGADAEYYVPPSTTRTPLRVVVSQPDQAVAGFQLSSMVESTIITVAVADLEDPPEQGDRFDVCGELFEVREVQRDATRTAWRVVCRTC